MNKEEISRIDAKYYVRMFNQEANANYLDSAYGWYQKIPLGMDYNCESGAILRLMRYLATTMKEIKDLDDKLGRMRQLLDNEDLDTWERFVGEDVPVKEVKNPQPPKEEDRYSEAEYLGVRYSIKGLNGDIKNGKRAIICLDAALNELSQKDHTEIIISHMIDKIIQALKSRVFLRSEILQNGQKISKFDKVKG